MTDVGLKKSEHFWEFVVQTDTTEYDVRQIILN